MDSDETTFKDVRDRLDELIAWQRFESLPKLRAVLLKELDSETKKLAYEMTDGEKSRRDIASALSVSDDNIQGWWQRWYELAIVRPSKLFKGRPQHLVSLEDVGIKVPKITPAKKEIAQIGTEREGKIEAQPTEGIKTQKSGEENA